MQTFAFLVRSLCVAPCAVSLCVILCNVRWHEVCGPGNHNAGACLKVLVRVLVRALCVHCALLVDAPVQVNGMNHCMSETSCGPCAVLVPFPCAESFRILVQHPPNSAQGNWISLCGPCADFFRLILFDIKYSTCFIPQFHFTTFCLIYHPI